MPTSVNYKKGNATKSRVMAFGYATDVLILRFCISYQLFDLLVIINQLYELNYLSQQ